MTAYDHLRPPAATWHHSSKLSDLYLVCRSVENLTQSVITFAHIEDLQVLSYRYCLVQISREPHRLTAWLAVISISYYILFNLKFETRCYKVEA
jgi:hypothetical protein